MQRGTLHKFVKGKAQQRAVLLLLMMVPPKQVCPLILNVSYVLGMVASFFEIFSYIRMCIPT